MLVLERKVGESVMIGDSIKVTICKVTETRVKVGITAPSDVAVDREEVRNKTDYVRGKYANG